MNPFVNLRIQPAFGQHTVVIAWDTPVECLGGSYFIYRSALGIKGTWELLNEFAPLQHGICHWVDDGQSIPPAGDTIHYRLLYVAPDGTEYDSDVVGLWDTLPREEYGMARMILNNEFFEMQHCGGIPVWQCVPLAFGELADNMDKATAQPVAVAGQGNYGLPFKGGFAPPLLTWVKFDTVQHKSADRDDGMGFDEDVNIQGRFLAFPRLRRGHMIVNPHTDDRYVVASEVTPYLLRGMVPVAYSAGLTRLCQEDYRRRFPVPPIIDSIP